MGTKKLLISVMLILFIAAAGLQAGEERNNQYYFNIGSGFFYYIPLPHFGFSADIPFKDNLVFSPEAEVTFVLIYPAFFSIGAQINYIGERYFLGGGLSRYFFLYADADDWLEEGATCLKVNAGRKLRRLNVSVYAVLPLLSGWDLPMIGISFKFKL